MMGAFGFQEPSYDCTRYMRLIESEWPSVKEGPSDQVLALVEQAVDQCPHVPELWMMRADLIELYVEHAGESNGLYEREDVLLCLEAAARVRPDFIEAHEAIAEFCENKLNDLPAAQAAYERAVHLGGGPWVYTGLARVLARQGRYEQAMSALDPEFCPYHNEADVQEARRQLEGGNFLL